MILALIQSDPMNATSHPIIVQILELIMTFEKHYISDEKAIKSMTEEIFLDIIP